MLHPEDVSFLWIEDMWDYPRSGALEWEGKRYWFAETEWDSGVFDIIDMDEETWARADREHELFRKHVGTHNDFTDGKTPLGRSIAEHHASLRPQEEWHKFYDVYPPGTTLTPQGTVVAQWGFDD